MPQNRRIYLLDPKKNSPETIAVTFAKTSRSPLPFDAIAKELSDESAANFHEKWVVGYGHSSVAEHAVLHIAVENVSRLSIECLESNRLASYTEKSSRYQVWDVDHFHIPEEFSKPPLNDLYIRTCKALFNAYQKAFPILIKTLEKRLDRKKGESERRFQARVRSASADVCRYFLPAGALANVGISINARALEHAISKMLSHPLLEVQAIGEEIKWHALEQVPTLVKYANPTPYLKSISREAKVPCQNTPSKNTGQEDWCTCISFDREGQNKILTALIYRSGNLSMTDAINNFKALDDSEKSTLVHQLTEEMGKHDQLPREFEYATVMFDLILDQGAYFELKRHRMMTQTVQTFTPYLGFAMPKLIEICGISDLFITMMNKAQSAYEVLARENRFAAAYVLPNAFNRRVLLEMNLRTAFHLIKLRCAENAHFAIRRPTLRMAEILQARFPLFSEIFLPCSGETSQMVEKEYFTETRMQTS